MNSSGVGRNVGATGMPCSAMAVTGYIVLDLTWQPRTLLSVGSPVIEIDFRQC